MRSFYQAFKRFVIRDSFNGSPGNSFSEPCCKFCCTPAGQCVRRLHSARGAARILATLAATSCHAGLPPANC